MRRFSNSTLKTFVLTLLIVAAAGLTTARAQQASTSKTYSDSDSGRTRTRSARTRDAERDPAAILRAARTIYVEPGKHIDSKYLEYKLGKYPEFQQWKLSLVKDRDKADLVLNVHQRMLNYIFSIEEPASSIVVVNGKVVAINDLVAAEDIAREIIRRMKNTRALPID